MADQFTPTEHSQLWDRFRTGSPGAFSQLYRSFAADLYSYGYRLVRHKELVEDCLHELFLHIHENRSRLGYTDNIRYYLCRALRRRLAESVERLNRLESSPCLLDRPAFLTHSYESLLIDEQVVAHQQRVLETAMNRLPKRQKEILHLVYLQGLTYPQAAEVMNLSMKSVYNTVHVALKTLRGQVKPYSKHQAFFGF
ncbi:RNA polymerase sigma factor [Spirosoma sp. 209]|uniref:RNA polymerase sigma factor n=1 Tax=Spirosoma sp. 209 TaxID=1955701 RepID=UPI00098D25E9|nr:sigma-70 family RNA polymerase sigma factor [Spirosoma sp. 209]